MELGLPENEEIGIATISTPQISNKVFCKIQQITFGGKVRTTKIRTSKFKKNIKNVSKHQNIESVHLNFHKSDQNIENQKYQLPMAYYLWIPRPVGG
jgi:hypothetical protein